MNKHEGNCTMKNPLRKIIFTKDFGIATIILIGIFGFSLFFEHDDRIVLPTVTLFNDVMNNIAESIRKSNYDASTVLDCNDDANPYNEYECFSNAFHNCFAATVSPEIYTVEGDPIYATLRITSDCKIEGTVDTSTDRFAMPEVIITKCTSFGRGGYTWSVGSCDADHLHDMEFNFEMQLYPKILDCEESGNIWISERLECVVN